MFITEASDNSRFENANNLAYHITFPSNNTQVENNEHNKVHRPHFLVRIR